MPLGITRLNARHQPPNPLITFIKPLPGPDHSLAQAFLERIAAISAPIMKAHHLSLTTLEEHAPNAEFVGRNFNGGEVIQLVLKAPSSSGRWLPFRAVQLVMMHELAHCVHMNHSGAFWGVRDGFVGELRGLWDRGYTGDGFWGRGRAVWGGDDECGGGVGIWGEDGMARSLCGGTFRSGRGKRRRRKREGTGEALTYAERRAKRIARRFGVNGVALGDDEEARARLEEGRRPKGKPRVAGSARGRELRAAAALARFGQQEEEDVKREEEQGSGSETDESDYEVVVKEEEEAVDVDGSKMLDGKGRALVKVCEDEDKGSVEVQREMQELQELNQTRPMKTETPLIKQEEESTASEAEPENDTTCKVEKPSTSTRPSPERSNRATPSPSAASKALTTKQNTQRPPPTDSQLHHTTCPICSLTNAPASPTCAACAHVLDPSRIPNPWRCSSPACHGSLYLNAVDCGVCGVCGTKRAARVGG